jgi:hypothetical protein
MDTIGVALKDRLSKIKTPKKGGATYEWQDRACKIWNAMGLKGSPSKGFFKLVRDAVKNGREGLIESTYSYISDANPRDPEKLFYWVYYHKLNKKI